jgi:hypothetical protein
MDKDLLVIGLLFVAPITAIVIGVTVYYTTIEVTAIKAGLHQDVVQGHVIWVK